MSEKFDAQDKIDEINANKESIMKGKKLKGQNPESVDRLKSEIIYCEENQEKEALDKIIKRIEDFPETIDEVVLKIDGVIQEYRDEIKKNIGDVRTKRNLSKIHALEKLKELFFEKFPEQKEKEGYEGIDEDIMINSLFKNSGKDNEPEIVKEFEVLFKKDFRMRNLASTKINLLIDNMQKVVDNPLTGMEEELRLANKIEVLKKLKKRLSLI